MAGGNCARTSRTRRSHAFLRERSRKSAAEGRSLATLLEHAILISVACSAASFSQAAIGACQALSRACHSALRTSPQAHSNRVPTAVAQPVPITAPLTSRVSRAERDANASPSPPSSSVALTFCDPRKTPLALYR
jgi:hypothetical protein